MRNPTGILLLLLVLGGGLGANECNTERPWTDPHEPAGRELFTSPQANPLALSPDGTRLYVANTTSNSISIIDTTTNTIVEKNLAVGIDPVAIAVRPDGQEVWIANHVSDSVSVLDTHPASPTYHQIVASVQSLNASGITLFDEPVGIAFADATKAYVALSSRNQIAVVDVATRSVTSYVQITAQDPRAIAVRNGRLYVAAFESSNQTELSVCPGQAINPPQCTLSDQDVIDFVVESPNIPGADARIVVDPDVPDRDLYVFDASDESAIDVVEGVGTLLYGLAVDSSGEVFVTQADARNDVNGENGENLILMQNRMFLNQISRVDCAGASCSHNPATDRIELDTPPGTPIPAGEELATPYGIAISDDDSTLVATAAGTSRVFTVDTATGSVLDILDLGSGGSLGKQNPRGVALRSDGSGAPQTAYVLNTLENTVAVVDVSNPAALSLTAKLAVGNDPTPDEIRRGRMAFNNAFGSTSNTFSCASCHPDGNTDQLLWRIGGACFFGACTGDDEIRSTMPVRGLRNSLPLHWDGTLGDPFGGIDGSTGGQFSNPADCALGDADGDHDCFRDLVDASLSGVMCDQDPSCATGPSGLAGKLGHGEREDMAFFLASVAYPPARTRNLDDAVTPGAINGFADFFVDQPGAGFPTDAGDAAGVSTCADMDSGCHALPLGTDHNSSTLAGFDVPTMRGMTDRFLQFSIGISNAEENLVFANSAGSVELSPGIFFNFPASQFPWDPAQGYDERVTFAAAFPIFFPVYNVNPTDIFRMFEQASTGTSGALGRQVTLNGVATDWALLTILEAADAKDVVNLRGDGVHDGTPVTVSYLAGPDLYQVGPQQLTRAQLEAEVNAGDLLATLTARLPRNHGIHPMPLLSLTSTAAGATGNPDLPVLPGDNPMTLAGIDVHQDAQILVDGDVVPGTLSCVAGGSFTPFCDSETVQIGLSSVPATGLHLLQVQNPLGPLSPELPICAGVKTDCD
jgi:YVTN family beta-propeller protein